MIGFVISRKLWPPLVALMSAIIAVSALSISGCSFAEDNVGSVGDAAASAPSSTPQVPESMKTNDMGNGPQGPPQGL